VRDAVKKKLPEGIPRPGKFRLSGASAASSAQDTQSKPADAPASVEQKGG
jgi:large subunit ribosomal protein L3